MNPDVPYLVAVGNLHKILDAIQNAGAPSVFNREFLKDLGFTASQDRPLPRVLKYLGMLDDSGRPTSSYRDFMDHTKAKQVLANRMRIAFDDLFTSDKNAHTKTADQLKGWFKTKTGAGDAVAKKIATNFKALATYADFAAPIVEQSSATASTDQDATATDGVRGAEQATAATATAGRANSHSGGATSQVGLVYRIEIHLPDTQNVDTHRAIFRALREELM